MSRYVVAGLVVLSFLLGGCGSSKPAVKRVDTDQVIDLSGKWNDTDSRLVSEEMIQDCLGRPWLSRFSRDSGGRQPVVIVGTILNRSREHINVQTFSKDLERALINSGEVLFVASRTERDEVREERLDQASNASEETAKESGRETGADYMLKGSINTITDSIEGEYVIFYQIDLELIHLETNQKAWIGDKKIKKVVKHSRYKP